MEDGDAGTEGVLLRGNVPSSWARVGAEHPPQFPRPSWFCTSVNNTGYFATLGGTEENHSLQ